MKFKKSTNIRYYTLLQAYWAATNNLSTHLVTNKDQELKKILKQLEPFLKNEDAQASTLEEKEASERVALFGEDTKIRDDYKNIISMADHMKLDVEEIINRYDLAIPVEEIVVKTEEDRYQKDLGETQGTLLSGRFKI